jgi:DNA-binding MarR family transcriptional regulator
VSESLTPPDPRPGADANLGYLFRLAHQRFRRALDEGLRDTGLSGREYGILSVFATRPSLTTSALARTAQITRQSMHTAILQLERDGLLERRSENQRVVRLRLTPAGRRRLKAATVRVRATERAALAGLDPRDEEIVRAWLTTLASGTWDSRLAAASGRLRTRR